MTGRLRPVADVQLSSSSRVQNHAVDLAGTIGSRGKWVSGQGRFKDPFALRKWQADDNNIDSYSAVTLSLFTLLDSTTSHHLPAFA
jgi:hypothetical protein